MNALANPTLVPASPNGSSAAPLDIIGTQSMTAQIRLEDLPIEMIDRDPNNVHANCPPAKVEVMRQSLLAIGLQTPIVVEEAVVPRRFLILHGHMRVAGSIAAGWTTIKAIVLPRSYTPTARLARQLADNEIRSGLNVAEKGRAYNRLLELDGVNQSELARRYGFENSDISRCLKVINDWPLSLFHELEDGLVPESCAYQIVQVADETARLNLAQRYLKTPLTREQLVRETARLNAPAKQPVGGEPAARKPIRRITCPPTETGRTTVTLNTGEDCGLELDDVLAALEAATKRARKIFNAGGDLEQFAALYRKPKAARSASTLNHLPAAGSPTVTTETPILFNSDTVNPHD